MRCVGCGRYMSAANTSSGPTGEPGEFTSSTNFLHCRHKISWVHYAQRRSSYILNPFLHRGNTGESHACEAPDTGLDHDAGFLALRREGRVAFHEEAHEHGFVDGWDDDGEEFGVDYGCELDRESVELSFEVGLG